MSSARPFLARTQNTQTHQKHVTLAAALLWRRCAAYYADLAAGSSGRDVAFNPDLGLAMEVLGGGATIAQLWSVV